MDNRCVHCDKEGRQSKNSRFEEEIVDRLTGKTFKVTMIGTVCLWCFNEYFTPDEVRENHRRCTDAREALHMELGL